MKVRSCALLMAIVIGLVSVEARAQETTRLRFRTRPFLVDCLDRPCFRIDVIAVDAQDQPVELPESTEFEVYRGDVKLPKVYVTRLRGTRSSDRGGEGTAAPQIPRVTMVLFDTSGSMNDRLPDGETKFAVARRQLDALFEGFRDQIDLMAIAPFDSQRVAARIRGAQFQRTRDGLRRQVETISPNRTGNTALFSAIDEGLRVLEPYAKRGAQAALIVFTDGKNDVQHRSDDPGLLSGADGLARVRTTAADVGITINTIGYGAPGASLDEPTLRSLAYPNESTYFRASDEASVKNIFGRITARAATGYRLLTGPLSERRDQLMNTSVILRVKAGNLTATSPPWVGPPVSAPPTEGELTSAERKAVIGWRVQPAGLPSVAIRMIVLLSYTALIAMLWFGLPRLIWPERYVPKPAVAARPKPGAAAAAGARPGGRPGAPPSRPAPGRPAAAPPRGPAGRPEVTIPQSRPPARPAPGAAPPGRDAMPPRPRPAQSAPPPARPREQPPSTDVDETTRIFIPPAKKPGRDS
jgi:hypothetical protein